VCLLQLVALVGHLGQVQVQLADVREADVAGIDEGREFGVGRRPHLQRDFMVKLADGDVVKLGAGEAEVLELGWAMDLSRG
jgi:hypothetical protein